MNRFRGITPLGLRLRAYVRTLKARPGRRAESEQRSISLKKSADGPSPLLRRQWLGQLPVPAIAASLGADLASAKRLGAQSAKTAAAGNDLGARVYNVRDYGAK